MINIQLPTGNTISISVYEYYFMLKDEDMDDFYRSCVADDLGTYIADPFSGKKAFGKLEIDDDEELSLDEEE